MRAIDINGEIIATFLDTGYNVMEVQPVIIIFT